MSNITEFFNVDEEKQQLDYLEPIVHSDDIKKNTLADYHSTRESMKTMIVRGTAMIDDLIQVAKDMGVPKSCIYIKGNILPGFFRPTKDWDFLIVTPKNQLITVVELKSQVGSFGNNFNNRTEEALGSAVDLWTAFRKKGFPQSLHGGNHRPPSPQRAYPWS